MLADAPWAFGASPDDDELLDPDRLGRRLASLDHATFAIEEGEPGTRLVAAASITRSGGLLFAHRARIEAVHVDPPHRGRGLGRRVVGAALDVARTWPGVDFVDLGVSDESPAARRLYESFGFAAWGREPEATACEGRRIDEIHMTLRLV